MLVWELACEREASTSREKRLPPYIYIADTNLSLLPSFSPPHSSSNSSIPSCSWLVSLALCMSLSTTPVSALFLRNMCPSYNEALRPFSWWRMEASFLPLFYLPLFLRIPCVDTSVPMMCPTLVVLVMSSSATPCQR